MVIHVVAVCWKIEVVAMMMMILFLLMLVMVVVVVGGCCLLEHSLSLDATRTFSCSWTEIHLALELGYRAVVGVCLDGGA